MYAASYTTTEIHIIFEKLRRDHTLDAEEIIKIKSALLSEFALWDHGKRLGTTVHLGALRNNNTRALQGLGP